ncbi:MAG: putative lipoprotein [Saprospiraceae bacterium]|jgi:predicted lipoprotein|tara:strand:- start:1769 stop:2395 length:627 start_codon:yes stop_codon:yes gene_type:complete
MKINKYSVGILLLVVVVYYSVNLKKLDEVKAGYIEKEFDVETYALEFWDTKLQDAINESIDINLIINGLKSNPENTFETYAQQLGISKVHHFMVKGNGVINAITEEYMEVSVDEGSVNIATEFIFGNSVRDSSGKVNINEFENLMDFNMVSVAINKQIRENIIPQLVGRAIIGQKIEFVGAVEVNEENMENLILRIILVQSTASNDRN